MKTKKSIIKISLISMILLLLIAMFNRSYGSVMAIAGATGLVGVLIAAIQYLILLIGMVAETIIVAVGALAPGSGSGSIGDIVFNQCAATTPNFFPEIFNASLFKDSSAIWSLTQTVGQYYSIIRYLAIAILLIILIYIGIRMAMSTVASEEAKYKKMFFHWAVSLVIVFVLHYIIIITLYINNVLVEALYNSIGGDIKFGDYAKMAAAGLVPIAGFPNVIVYVSAVVINLIFMFMYIKRLITLAFLIIISPLITVTYSIDKMGDGKSQALNTWLKEFIFTVLIQPFHCIIYIVFVRTAFNLIASNGEFFDENFDLFINIGKEFLAIVCMTFMLQAEKIVKKIFGIQADSMGDAVGAAALTVGLMQGAFKLGKQKKEGASGRKAPDMRDNNVTDTGRRGTKNARNSNAANTTNSSKNSGASNSSSTSNNSSTTATTTSSGNTNTSNGSTATRTASTAPISNALNNASNTSKKDSQFTKGFIDAAKRMTGEKDIETIPRALLKSVKPALRGAVVGTAAIAGGTASGADGALSAGLAAYGATGNWKSNDIGKYNEKQLEINQEVLAGAYEDFAEEYRNIHGQDVSDLDILAAAKDLYENTGSGAGLDDYELDFYKKMDAMKDTYEALGYDDAWEGIEESIQLIQAKEITPHDGYIHKSYSGSSSNTQQSTSNSNQQTQSGQSHGGRSNNNQQTRQSQGSRQNNNKQSNYKPRGYDYYKKQNAGNSGQMDNIDDILDDLNKKKNK